jgi:RimJ/RimL family protein N-acetyltransferase
MAGSTVPEAVPTVPEAVPTVPEAGPTVPEAVPTVPPTPLPRRTERLVLRPFRHGDEADVLAYRGRPDVVRYMPAEPLRARGAAAFIAERMAATQIKADEDKIILAIEHDGRVIGDLLVRAGQLADRQAEIGWALHPGYHGRGLATEAARELLALAFADLGMHRVFAQLDPRNAASARLCERLGMRREAYFREDLWFKGEWGDTAVYALLAAEWHATTQPR